MKLVSTIATKSNLFAFFRTNSALLFPKLNCLFFTVACAVWLSLNFALPHPVVAQELEAVRIPTPEAAALVKSGEIPVSPYTGVPDISVPIWTISAGEIQIPIALSYHASGIKVEQEATWVGLGWNLSGAGGSITRAIRGGDDFGTAGWGNYYSQASMTPIMDNGYGSNFQARLEYTGDNHIDYLDQYLKTLYSDTYDPFISLWGNAYDYQADLFYVNAGNLSAKFLYTPAGEWLCLDNKDIIIRYNGFFSITDADGLIYRFDRKETSQYNSEHVTGSAGPPALSESISSWYLTEILTPDNVSRVQFVYKDVAPGEKIVTNKFRGYEIAHTLDVSNPQESSYDSYSKIDKYYLSEIRYSGNRVVFSSTKDRTDLTNAEQLNTIAVYNQLGDEVKKVSFDYGYFSGGGTNDRLKLNSVTFDNDVEDRYQFYYYTKNLPSKNTGFDHWGYYNGGLPGAVRGYFELPSSCPGTTAVGLTGTADRNAHFPYTQSFILNKIVYPGKGYSVFEYEPNDFANVPERDNHDISFIPSVTYPKDSINSIFDQGKSYHFNLQSNACMTIDGHYVDGCNGLLIELFKVGTEAPIQTWNYSQYTVVNGHHVLKLDEMMTLAPGRYKLKVTSSQCSGSTFNDWAFIMTLNGSPIIRDLGLTKKEGGGLRIKKIKNYDRDKLVSHKEYHYQNSDGSTSGLLMSHPLYLSSEDFFISTLTGNVFAWVIARVSSSSKAELSSAAQGSYVGYSKVRESVDSAGRQGYTLYEYTNSVDDLPLSYLIPSLNHHQNGLLTKKSVKSADGALLMETINEYNQTNFDSAKYSFAMVPDIWFRETLNPDAMIPYNTLKAHLFFYREFQMVGSTLRKSTQRMYLPGTDLMPYETVVDYKYKSGLLPSRTVARTSDDRTIISEVRYPRDYPSTISGFVADMRTRNIVNKPIEAVTYEFRTPANRLISGVVSQYGSGSEAGLLKSRHLLRYDRKFDWQGGDFSDVRSATDFVFDSGYELEQSYSYSDRNLSEWSKSSDLKTACIWGYSNSTPIAVVKNAGQQQAFYTSFEEDGVDFLDGVGEPLARTGRKVKEGGTYTFPSLFSPPAGYSYSMSYWYYNGSSWSFSGVLPFSRTITSAGQKLDEVRVFPVGALMTTYSHIPSLGVTSVTDPNNVTTYYTYDEFHRLESVKDHLKNIVKVFQYNYRYHE